MLQEEKGSISMQILVTFRPVCATYTIYNQFICAKFILKRRTLSCNTVQRGHNTGHNYTDHAM